MSSSSPTYSSPKATKNEKQSFAITNAAFIHQKSHKKRIITEPIIMGEKKKAKPTPPPSSSSSSYTTAKPSHKKNNVDSNQQRTDRFTSNLSLPVYSFEEQIVQSVRSNPVTIIVGETGSGKSTQIPQILINHGVNRRDPNQPGGGGIVCTQPRRVAAVTIAQKVASERNCALGQEVGYSIRFEDKSSAATKIKYVTDGVLLRECMGDSLLRKYSIIILDEAHERSLQTDILMGLLKRMQQEKLRGSNDLRIIVMSATLQIDLFSSFFEGASIVIIPGRQYPVTVYYAREPEADFVDAARVACLQIHEVEEPGDVLVFLPGQEDIESLTQLLQDNLPTVKSYFSTHRIPLSSTHNSSSTTTTIDDRLLPSITIEEDGSKTVGIENLTDFVICPLYASMPPDEQLKVFNPLPQGIRKFILSTNIAETSVTISGVKYVVDTGFVKTRFINEHTGIEMLKTMPVSKSQANQRAGRAGRESPGKCFRLYPEEIFDQLAAMTIPEIQRMNIAQVFLQLKTLQIQSFNTFPFISPPTAPVVRQALETLLQLGALDRDQNLTEIGQKLALLPLHPNFSYFLVKSQEFQCVQEALIAVCLLSVDNIFLQPFRDEDKQKAYQAHRVFASKDGDVITLINIYSQWIKAKKDKKWTSRNFLSYRGLSLAENIQQQLTSLLQQKLKIDTTVSCYPDRKEQLLKCLLVSFSKNIAQSIQSMDMKEYLNVKREETANSNLVVKNNNKFAFSNYRPKNSISPLLAEIQSKNSTNAPYRTLKGQQFVHIHPSSVLFSMIKNKKLPGFVLYADLLITNKQYMKYISVVDGSWLTEFFPDKFKTVA